MAELQATSTEYALDTVNISVEDPALGLATASAIAKAKARDMDSNAMMLSYHSGKTGEFWPKYECGGGGRPPWIVFAESRGYNLKIDINNGEYEFFYLRF
ncbi:MAG: AF1514 family protein [Desulfosarcina sp.]|nr:AF1514 family protein [Desulfosarcina sp.]MBC2743293.1 AF1514 family protein [Desulfosarcina sp.]MBC2766203.1 AF1514 family protein [Desulfosarcina sp.]